MAANDKILEALARIEHKVDLCLKLARRDDPKLTMKKLGEVGHLCPLCDQTVDYQIDINEGVVLRKCGCKTGKIALNIGAFAPPALPVRKKDEDNGGTDQEDRGDTDRGRRPGRR